MSQAEQRAQSLPVGGAPLLHLAQRLFDTPLAIATNKYEIILDALKERLAPDAELLVAPPSEQEQVAFADVQAGGDELPEGTTQAEEGYKITPEGIAVVSVRGTLVKKSAWADATSGLVSYASLGRQIEAAIANPGVRGVLLDVNSPGGETHGMFDLADQIYALRGQKPVYAIANDAALSAAYLIASAADRIFLTRTGCVGSIGVFTCHVDQSGADKNAGLKPTYIFAGRKKIDGNPHEPLSAGAKRDAQAETDRQYGMFVEAVARDRDVEAQAIIDTEAGVFAGDKALPLLADEIGCFADAYQALLEKSGIILPETNTVRNVSQAPRANTLMPVIPYQKTLTVRKSWSASENRKRLNAKGTQSYYSKAHAYRDADLDPTTKSAYTFIHHEVAPNGTIGAANLTACSSGIGVLNGGRGGQGRSTYTPGERRGIYNHLARHQKDAKETPAPLKAYGEYIDARLALGLISAPLARALYEVISALSASDPGLLAEHSLEEGDDMAAKTRTENDEVLRRLAHQAEAEDAEDGKRAAAAGQDGEDDDEEEEEDGDKDKRRAKKGKKGDHYLKKAKDDEKDDADEDEDEDEDADEDADEDGDKKEPKGRKSDASAVRIMQLCELAGYPAKALLYVRRGYSVAQVIRKLGDLRAAPSNAPDQATHGFGIVKTSSLEQLMTAAQQLAATKGIPVGAAYEQILRANPRAYAEYVQEKIDATGQPGSSAAKAYADSIQRLIAQGSDIPQALLLRTNVGDAAGR